MNLNNSPSSRFRLSIRDRLVGVALLALGAFLVTVTYIAGSTPLRSVRGDLMEVTVEGAVSRPGTFLVPKKSRVGDLLKLAKPDDEADLNQINELRYLRSRESLKLTKHKTITVYLQGRPEISRVQRLLKGAHLDDLIQIVGLEAATLPSEKRRDRVLRDNEVIWVNLSGGRGDLGEDCNLLKFNGL